MPTIATQTGKLAYFDSAPGSSDKPIVVLLHSSASAALQWRKLIGEIAIRYRVVAPDLIGYGATPMTAQTPTMEDELDRMAALAAVLPGQFHLVGHSYGGSVALEAARIVGARVKSLALYEPVSMHLLKSHGKDAAWQEISAVAARHIALVEAGHNEAAAEAFMTYWTGPGSYAAMRPDLQSYVVGTMPKVAAEWRMMLERTGTAEAYAGFDFPVLVMTGSRSTLAARAVTEVLCGTLPGVTWQSLPCISHMGPVTHPAPVNASITAFLDKAERKRGGPLVPPAPPANAPVRAARRR